MNIKRLLLLAITFSLSSLAQAEVVKIAFVSSMTGPLAITAQSILKASRGYINMINAEGGINGNQIVMIEKDDEYDPRKTPALMAEAIMKDNVIAFANTAGTGPGIAIIKSRVLNKFKVPLVGIFSGSEALRGPGSEEIFHTRPTYNDEIMKISRSVSTIGLQRVAVLYQDDAFGQSILKSVSEGERAYKVNAFLKVPYKAGAKDFTEQVKTITAAQPQAIFLMGVPEAVCLFMKAYNAPTGASQIYALSFVPPKLLAHIAGAEKARGVAITQVVPNPHSAVLPLIKDFQRLMSSPYGQGVAPEPIVLEGYLNIRVLLAAVKMAGPHPTSEKVMQSLASMHNSSIGGFPIDFAGGKRSGSDFLDIAVVGAKARLLY